MGNKDKKSQSTGSFFGDLKKSISSGGSSKLTKNVKVKKGDTLSDIAKANNTTLKKLMSLNPKFKTGQGPSMKYNQNSGPISEGTTQQKEMKLGSSIKVPDPQSFQGGRLKPVRTKKKKKVYADVKKPEFKEMSQKVPLMAGGKVKKMMGGGMLKPKKMMGGGMTKIKYRGGGMVSRSRPTRYI